MDNDSEVELGPLTSECDDEPVTPGAVELPPRAGDLGDLAVERLATEGHWTALAALAHHTRGEGWGLQALRQLVQHADDPDAFAWLWALLPEQTPRAWAGLNDLPHPLIIPAHLITNVTSEVMSAVINRGSNSRGLIHLLRVLEPADSGTVQIAGAILAPGANPPDEFFVEALKLLGANRDPAVRDYLLADADAAAEDEPANVERYVRIMAALQLPLRDVEVLASERAADLLTASTLMNPAWATQHAPWAWPALRILAPRLSPENLVQLCSQPWITGEGGGDTAAALFTNGLRTEAVTALLGRATSFAPHVRDALLQHVAARPDDEGLRLIEEAHRVVPIAHLSPMHASLIQQVEETTHLNVSARLGALRRLQAAALAVPRAQPLHVTDEAPSDPPVAVALGSDPALQAWTRALRPGEISEVVCSELATEQLRHLGGALGLLLRLAVERGPHSDYTSAQAESDAVHVLHDLDDPSCAAVLQGLTAVAAGNVPKAVRRLALDTGSEATTVMAAAEPANTAAQLCDALTADPTALPVERVLDVLEAVPANTSITSVQALIPDLDWYMVEEKDLLERAAVALLRHPALHRAAVSRAVRSQQGPTHEAVSSAHLSALLEPMLDAAATTNTRDEHEETAELVEILIDAANIDSNVLAGRWLRRIAPSDTVVQLVIRADDDTATRPSPYAAARTDLAETLCQRAVDPDQDVEQRGHFLTAAAKLDAQAARQVALILVSSAPKPLRRTAAGVLVSTPAVANDAEHLAALAEAQNDRPTRTLLQAAQRRVTSGSTDEALTNLLDMLSISQSYGDLSISVLLPLANYHQTFQKWVDEARASRGDTTRNHVNTLIILADFLAEQTIVRSWTVDSIRNAESRIADLLSHGSKEDIGALVRQQSLLEGMPWLSHLASLRDLRTAHPTNRGSTTPLTITAEDAVTALALTRRVTEGWIGTMYRLATQPLPQA